MGEWQQNNKPNVVSYHIEPENGEENRLEETRLITMYCRRCGAEIGRYVMVESDEMVQVGGLLVAELHGNCVQCGEAFHYSLNAKRLEKLIRRVNKK
jgi:hypothetical protein